MVRVIAAAGLIATFAFPLAGQIRPVANVAVVLDFKSSHPALIIGDMEREAERILGAGGIELAWIMRDEATGVYGELVVLTFLGSCGFVADPPAYYESGSFAITRTVGGEVLPFAEVDCPRVVRAVRAAMSGGDRTRADQLIGRALGRIVAHEMVHMLTKSGEHSPEGIEQPALSGRQLIMPVLSLSAFDLERLRASTRGRASEHALVETSLKGRGRRAPSRNDDRRRRVASCQIPACYEIQLRDGSIQLSGRN